MQDEWRICECCNLLFSFHPKPSYQHRPNVGRYCSADCRNRVGGKVGGRPPAYLSTDKERVCAKCKIKKSITEFARDAKMSSGISHVCKLCKNAARADRYYANHESEKARHRAFHKQHQERYTRQNKLYLLKHPEKAQQYVQTRNAKSSYKAARQRWLHTTIGQAYRRFKHQRRRARHLNASGKATRVQIEARVAFYGGLCWICRAPYAAIDHVKPLTKGGSHWPANLRPICLSCNSKKHNIWPFSLEQKIS